MTDSASASDEQLIRETRQYARTILDSLSAHVAIIDRHGRILETNRAWKEFASSNQIGTRPDTLGVNYLEICDAARGDSADRAGEVASGIRQVINGDIDEFVIDYPCHSPGKRRWFYMRVTRAVGSGPMRVVVSHENITALKQAEDRLRQREEELEQKTVRLEEANAALRAVLRQRNDDVRELEEAVFQNVQKSILPGCRRIREMAKDGDVSDLVGRIETRLESIASPFLSRLASLDAVLTPREIAIADLIREGLSTKEIAGLLNLSLTTVNFHRRNLRAKLGLTNTAVNLRTHLLTLAKD